MPQIPQFTVGNEVAIQPNRARPELGALALPGEATARQGAQTQRVGAELDQVGEALGKLQQMQDYNYLLNQRAETATLWPSEAQRRMEEAEQTGNFAGLTSRLQSDMAQDFATREQSAPSTRAAAQLRRYNAIQLKELTGKASVFEHRMRGQQAVADLGSIGDSFATDVFRDPALAEDRYQEFSDHLNHDAAQIGLPPAQVKALQDKARTSIWSAAVLGRGAAGDASVLADLKGGRYDAYLDVPTRLQLQPHLENALVKGLSATLPYEEFAGGGGAVPPGAPAPETYRPAIAQAAAQYGVPAELLTRVLDAESSFNPHAVGKPNRSGELAQGIAQFLPSTARRYGIDPTVPEQAIAGAAHYLADLHKEKGSWLGALTGYLGGDPRQDASYRRAGAAQLAQALDRGGSAGGSLEIWGDSLGVGLQAQLKTAGRVHGGDTPQTIFDNIKAQPTEYWQGKTVVLPSGSNGNQMPVVEQTIAYLKGHGATVIAVGYGPKFPEKNAELQAIAARQGVPVVAAEDVAESEGVHPSPRGYAAMAQKIQQQIPAAGSPAPAAAPAGGLAQLYRHIDSLGLDPDLAAKLKTTARINYDALEADQARTQRLQAQAEKARSEAAENRVIADSRSDNPQITPQQVANDPDLTPEAKLRMITFMSKDGNVDPGLSHQTAIDLMKQIGAGAITDQAPLIDAFGQGKLNWTDFDHLNKQLADIRTPAGELFAKRKADFLKSIEPQIDKTVLTGIPDLEGKERFYRYHYMLDQKVDEFRKAGKDPGDLLNPAKPDYIGKPEIVQQYQGDLAKKLRDAQAAAAPDAAAPVDLKSKDGIVAAYRAGKIDRATATKALIDRGFAAPAPAPAATGPQVPLR